MLWKDAVDMLGKCIFHKVLDMLVI
ncbi:uncharacterized protein METZ01_LOCUS51663 [marine metagenome]|uniref:Uncharacterized protein n=1 Tax=marine metagenome TaxID=408172 RepID=A0A381S5Q8_9ZZZZ